MELRKECFVSVGATAEFPDLIRAALSHDCLQELIANRFTHLTVQFGASSQLFTDLKSTVQEDLAITGFAYDGNGLNQHVRRCQQESGVSEQGLVICHAGKSLGHSGYRSNNTS